MAATTMRTLPGRYAKFLTALVGNTLVYATITYGSTNKWVEIATAAAAALGVLAVPNTTVLAPGVLAPAPPAPAAPAPPQVGA